MITAEPNGVFTAILEAAPVGLAGTVGVRIENLDGTSQTARTTAGIAELEPGSGVYVKDDLIAPGVEGNYFVLWDDGALFASEELVVQSVGSAFAATSPDYATVAEVKGALGLAGQTYADVDIVNAIHAASRAIDNKTGRRFWQDGAASSRSYVPEAQGFLVIDDLANLTSVTVAGAPWTLDTDFYLAPANAAADNWPYTAIRPLTGRFPTQNGHYPGPDCRVTLVGKFGWPALPDAIAEATRLLAVRLMRRVREAGLGVIGFGADGSTVHISSADPDVDMLVAPYVKHFDEDL